MGNTEQRILKARVSVKRNKRSQLLMTESNGTARHEIATAPLAIKKRELGKRSLVIFVVILLRLSALKSTYRKRR